MRVGPVGNSVSVSTTDAIETIERNLNAIAKAHNISVDELVKSAESAGTGGPEYLVRVGNMIRRLEKLYAKQEVS